MLQVHNKTAMHILLLEPHQSRAEKIKKSLARVSYTTDVFHSPDAALTRLERTISHYDVILVNALQPNDGLGEWCAAVRALGITTPIIVLSTIEDSLLPAVLLLQGVDDVIQLPVRTIELVARIQAVTRRPSAIKAPITAVGDIAVDSQCRTVHAKEEPVELSRKEFLLLECLAKSAPDIVTRYSLLGSVWEVPDAIANNTLDAHIKNIRRKLHHRSLCRIETVRGIGYRLVA